MQASGGILTQTSLARDMGLARDTRGYGAVEEGLMDCVGEGLAGQGDGAIAVRSHQEETNCEATIPGQSGVAAQVIDVDGRTFESLQGAH